MEHSTLTETDWGWLSSRSSTTHFKKLTINLKSLPVKLRVGLFTQFYLELLKLCNEKKTFDKKTFAIFVFIFFILRWNVLLNQTRGWYYYKCFFLNIGTLSKVEVELCFENSPVHRFKTATTKVLLQEYFFRTMLQPNIYLWAKINITALIRVVQIRLNRVSGSSCSSNLFFLPWLVLTLKP